MTNSNLLKTVEDTNLDNSIKISNDYYLCEMNDYKYFILMYENQKVGAVLNCGFDIHIIVKPEFRNKHIMSDFLSQHLIQKYWPDICELSLVLDGLESKKDVEKKIHLAEIAGLKIANLDDVMFYYNKILIND